MFINLKNYYGFTLAEILITIAIVGVTAAISLPILISNINERINSERQANIAYKITQAIDQMRAHGKLITYASTDDFVDELQKYLKITKRCDADHIAECWPTDTVITSSGEEYNVANCKTRKNLLSGSDTDGDNVGLILADGASIILTYDTNYQGKDIGDNLTSDSEHLLPVGNGKFRNFAYTTNVTGGIDFVMDVNGKKGPNSEKIGNKYNDIRQFRIAQFTNSQNVFTCTGDEYNDVCVKFIDKNYDSLDCTDSKINETYYNKYCGSGYNVLNTDFWAGAQLACSTNNMRLPTVNEINNIYNNQKHYPSISAFNGWLSASEENPNLAINDSMAVCFNDCNGWPSGNAYGYTKGAQTPIICVH